MGLTPQPPPPPPPPPPTPPARAASGRPAEAPLDPASRGGEMQTRGARAGPSRWDRRARPAREVWGVYLVSKSRYLKLA